MVSEVERLEQELAAAKKRLKDSKDISFCTVDRVRAFAAQMERILSIRPHDEESLEHRLEVITNSTRKVREDYSNSLWIEDHQRRC